MKWNEWVGSFSSFGVRFVPFITFISLTYPHFVHLLLDEVSEKLNEPQQ